jgi:hypothetical protein
MCSESQAILKNLTYKAKQGLPAANMQHQVCKLQ